MCPLQSARLEELCHLHRLGCRPHRSHRSGHQVGKETSLAPHYPNPFKRSFLRHYHYEHKLACLLWKVDIREVVFNNSDSISMDPSSSKGNVVTRRSLLMTFSHDDSTSSSNSSLGPRGKTNEACCDLGLKRTFTRTGSYRGNIVAIKVVCHKGVDLTRNIRKELKQMTEIRHENIVPFIGASVDYGGVFILTSYCARGSLQDVLQNPDFKLDTIFIASLVADLIKVIGPSVSNSNGCFVTILTSMLDRE